MMSNIPLIVSRMRVNLAGVGSVASDVTVCWSLTEGGTADPGTGGNVGGTETFLSGTMRGIGYEVPARNSVVKFAEVEVGDLILDLAASPEVTLFEGQSVSGAKPLDDLADHGLRFIWNGKVFSTQNISPDLQATWDAYVGNQQLHRTLLLRRA